MFKTNFEKCYQSVNETAVQPKTQAQLVFTAGYQCATAYGTCDY